MPVKWSWHLALTMRPSAAGLATIAPATGLAHSSDPEAIRQQLNFQYKTIGILKMTFSTKM
jgi:hypothetical protein